MPCWRSMMVQRWMTVERLRGPCVSPSQVSVMPSHSSRVKLPRSRVRIIASRESVSASWTAVIASRISVVLWKKLMDLGGPSLRSG